MNYMTRLLFYNFRAPMKKGYYHCKRNLLSATALGLDRFLESKKIVNNNIKDKERFIKEMEEASNSENDTLIFTNDIKKIVMLVSEENLEIIPKLLKKLSLQNETIKFQRYVFGPDIMKLYHLFNKPAEALALVEDKHIVQHFIQITSFSVLSDLLFKNGMYQDVICIYQYFHSRANVHRNAVQAMVVLYFGACYKLNSRNSLDEAISLWKKLDRKGIRLHKRALGFLGLLALNQNKPQIAIETMHYSRPDPILLSIKAMSLAKSKRYADVIQSIQDAFSMDNNLFITADAVSYIKDQLTNDKIEFVPRFYEVIDELKANKYISNKSLDEVLLEELDVNLTYKTAQKTPLEMQQNLESNQTCI